MPTSIITTDDLQVFKQELLEELKELLSKQKLAPKRYLRSAEVMKMLHISPGTLQTMRVNGTLPFTKVGGIIYYDQEEIHSLLARNRTTNL